MKIFIDTAKIGEIEEAISWEIVDGVTTNPSLIKEALNYYKGKGENISMEDYIKKLLTIVGENVTLVMTPNQALLAAKAGARYISPFAGRVDDYLRKRVKMSFEKGDYFPYEGLKINEQIINDNGVVNGVDLVQKCVDLIETYGFECEVIAASVRKDRLWN